jgi:hypothetical protein
MQVLDCVADQFDQTQIVTGVMFELAPNRLRPGAGGPPDAACPGVKFDWPTSRRRCPTVVTATTDQGLTVMNAIDEYVVTLDDVGNGITVNANVTVTFSGSGEHTCTNRVLEVRRSDPPGPRFRRSDTRASHARRQAGRIHEKI